MRKWISAALSGAMLVSSVFAGTTVASATETTNNKAYIHVSDFVGSAYDKSKTTQSQMAGTKVDKSVQEFEVGDLVNVTVTYQSSTQNGVSGFLGHTFINQTTDDASSNAAFAKYTDDSNEVMRLSNAYYQSDDDWECYIVGHPNSVFQAVPGSAYTVTDNSYTYDRDEDNPFMDRISYMGIAAQSTGMNFTQSTQAVTFTVEITNPGNTYLYSVLEDFTDNSTQATSIVESAVVSTTLTKVGTVQPSVADCTITLSKDSYVYNAYQRKPDVTVVYGSETLVKGTDYTVSYQDNINVGVAKVIITGKGNYIGTVTKTFTITGKPITQASATLSQTAYTYDGTAKTPAVEVTYNDKVLTENTDYTVSYENNTNIGTASVIISGINTFSGTLTKHFTISGQSVADATITLEKDTYVYNASKRTPAVTVVYGRETLTKDVDYTVSYKNNVNVGTATVTVKGINTYSGTATKTFTITAKPITQAKAVLAETSYTYDGTAKTPAVTVTYNNKALVENRDYTVSYENNVNAGTAKVVITGINTYGGTTKKSFTITGKSLQNATATLAQTSYVYNGYQRKPDVTVVYDGETLVKDTDYTVSYKNNINAGTATVTIKGINNYKGTLTKTFTITGKPMTQTKASLSASWYLYDGTAKTPEVTVTYSNKTLTENTDYTVSYSNNVEVGTATVTITGKGNYAGTITKHFTIDDTVVEVVY